MDLNNFILTHNPLAMKKFLILISVFVNGDSTTFNNVRFNAIKLER